MSQEVVPLPELAVLDSLRHQLLHRPSQLLILLQVLRNRIRVLLHVEALDPVLVLRTRRVPQEAVEAGVDDVELGVEAGGVDDALALGVFAFEEDLGFAVAGVGVVGRGDGDGVAEEVADVGAELEEGFVGGVFGFLDVLESLGGF